MLILGTLFKNLLIHLRSCAKIICVLCVGIVIIVAFIFSTYKCMYSVTLDGKFLGYTEDKRDLQSRINNYETIGNNDLVAFVEIENKPKYDLCLMKKDTASNDDFIFDKVIQNGVSYYGYYAILNKGEEKFYVSSIEECEAVIAALKEKESNNLDDITYVKKYETELKEFTNQDTAVADLYVKKPEPKPEPRRTYTSVGSVNTSTNLSFNYASLGNVSLIKPVGGTITSRFGVRSSIRSSAHTGLDIATSKGTPICAAADGIVTYSGWKGSYGNLMVISHGDGVETYYAHCNRLYVSAGTSVSQGQNIAEVGSTGNSTGPHLHLEIRVNGVAHNPQNYLY